MQQIKLDWQEPLNFAQKISDNYNESSWVFLHSALNNSIKNSTSQIALFAQDKILCDDFFAAEKIIRSGERNWFGYFSYEVGQQFENLPETKKSFISLPKIWLVNFGLIFNFNHDKKELTADFIDENLLQKTLNWNVKHAEISIAKTSFFNSNFTDDSYLNAISAIKKQISVGDFYQTNLTRKFFGEFEKKLSPQENFQLFLKLTKLSPANYSSFLKLDENYIISSSPELFLKIKNRKIISRPIKGTAPRGVNLLQDRNNKFYLKNSSKERSENLMIVDLVRNDFSRICEAGSVIVKKLFRISAYKNIFHMSSEVHGKIARNFDTLDALKTCLPAGSMTGAPKIKAICAAANFEKIDRGIYSGAIGSFSKKEINSAVVIRTLITNGEKFEFQTGGGITFDSDEKSELREIFSKAKSLAEILGINFKTPVIAKKT